MSFAPRPRLRPAARATSLPWATPWAVLCVLAALIATDPAAHRPARASCDALITPAEGRSSSATVDDGASNGVSEGRTDDVAVPPLQPATLPGSPAAGFGDAHIGDDENRFGDAFFQCYADAKQRDSASALSCVGEGARVGLESFFTRRDVHVSDDLSLIREQDDGQGRETPLQFTPDLPPLFDGQHRSVVDSAAAYLSARSLRWDIGGLYPGLVMRIGPTLSGSGWLEFVLEPRRAYSDRELGPSRMVLKQVVLPFLLGLKVSVASLVPLLLFAIVFLAKKALLMSQLSALVSGLVGFGAYAHHGHPHGFGGLDGGPGGPGGPLQFNNPLLPFRTSPQVFPSHPRLPPPVKEGPHIIEPGHNPLAAGAGVLTGPLPGTVPGAFGGGLGGVLAGTGGGFGLSPSWLSGTPQHLFRKVNYDFRDERHASASSPASSTTSHRNTKGFRWEDEVRHDGDPRTLSTADQRRSSGSRSSSGSSSGNVSSKGWGTLSSG